MNTYELNQPQRRWRKRRNQTAGSLISALTHLNDKFQESLTLVLESHRQLHRSKRKLRQHILEIKNLEREMKFKMDRYRHSVEQLETEIDDIGVVARNRLCEEEKITTWFAQSACVNARKQMHEIDFQFSVFEHMIVPTTGNSNSSESAMTEFPVPLTVELADVDSIGTIRKKGYLEISNTRKCYVCLENEINTLFYQCRHQCCCFTCAKGLVENNGKCPICRSLPKKVIKTYAI